MQTLLARDLPKPTISGVGVNVGRANIESDCSIVCPHATVAESSMAIRWRAHVSFQKNNCTMQSARHRLRALIRAKFLCPVRASYDAPPWRRELCSTLRMATLACAAMEWNVGVVSKLVEGPNRLVLWLLVRRFDPRSAQAIQGQSSITGFVQGFAGNIALGRIQEKTLVLELGIHACSRWYKICCLHNEPFAGSQVS